MMIMIVIVIGLLRTNLSGLYRHQRGLGFTRCQLQGRKYNIRIAKLVFHISSILIKREVGFYLHREGPNLGKHCVPRLLLPSALDAQFGTPYPISAGFDTDIGAFIESSSVASLQGLMAPSINNNTFQGETFPPGQIFVFGGLALRANSLGHLKQIDSYAPGHQISF